MGKRKYIQQLKAGEGSVQVVLNIVSDALSDMLPDVDFVILLYDRNGPGMQAVTKRHPYFARNAMQRFIDEEPASSFARPDDTTQEPRP